MTLWHKRAGVATPFRAQYLDLDGSGPMRVVHSRMSYLLSQSLALYHQAPVHRLRLDAVHQLQDRSGVLQALVLEALDGAFGLAIGLQSAVGPGDDLGLHDWSATRVEFGEEGEGVGSHQLPDQGQRQHLVTVHDVVAWGGEREYENRYRDIVTLPPMPTRTRFIFFPSSTA